MRWEADMDFEQSSVVADDLRDGDVLVYMSGRLLIVDHLVPEAFSIDLVELDKDEAAKRAAHSSSRRRG
jgi:hypothetical protein